MQYYFPAFKQPYAQRGVLPNASAMRSSAGSPTRFQSHTPNAIVAENNLRLKRAYIMGDLHFNNHIHDNQSGPLKTNRPQVVEKLDQMLAEYNAALQAKQPGKIAFELILNGDIFDLTDSWPSNVHPLDKRQHLPTVKLVIKEIMDHNPEIMDRFRQILSQDQFTIKYVIGNHERWLSHPAAQAHLKQKLGLQPQDPRLVFTRDYTDPALKLRVMHGDQFDPYCRPPQKGLNDAEKLDILVVKQLLTKLPETLQAQGYSESTIQQVRQALQSVEYVRPVHQIFTYLYKALSQMNATENRPAQAPPLLKTLIDETFSTLRAAYPESTLGQWLNQATFKAYAASFFTTSWGERLMNYITAAKVKPIRSDANQLAQARSVLTQADAESVKLLVLGHTHKILDKAVALPKNQYARVLNPGSFKTTILYPGPDRIYPAGLVRVQWRAEKPENIDVDLSLNQRRTLINPTLANPAVMNSR